MPNRSSAQRQRIFFFLRLHDVILETLYATYPCIQSLSKIPIQTSNLQETIQTLLFDQIMNTVIG